MATHARPQLHAEPRTRTGRKSDVKALRRSGKVPGSVFGHGEPDAIQLPARELKDFMRHHSSGALIDLVLSNGRPEPALIREIDRNPLTGEIITLGLQRVDLGEVLKATVPLLFTGEEDLVKEDLVFQPAMSELEVHARADQLPEAITIDVSHCKAGDTLRIGDLKLPEGVEATKDADLPVATISEPSVPADLAEALDAEEAEHEAEKAAHETEGDEAAADTGDDAS